MRAVGLVHKTKGELKMEAMVLKFDMTQTLFIAVILVLAGNWIISKVSIFSKYCIPSAVVGGLLFAIIALVLRQLNIVNFEFNTTLQQFFMNMFFVASGFGASMVLFKKGGKLVVIFMVLASFLAFLQNVIAVGMADIVGIPKMIALMAGSIPMTGGHGSAASFSPLAEEMGYAGAKAVAVAAATFGLVSGSIMGGPVASQLIKKHNLFDSKDKDSLKPEIDQTEEKPVFNVKAVTNAFNLIFVALGLGSIFFVLFQKIFPNITLPIHVMCMLGGVLMRIAMDGFKVKVPELEIDTIGSVCLGVFVSMSVCTMRLWELIDLALPILIILMLQVVLIYLFILFLTFPLTGKNYDAAVISAGHIGFGLGATPVAMANMKSVSDKYRYSKLAFFVVPVIGGMFCDFANVAIITAFMNWCK